MRLLGNSIQCSSAHYHAVESISSGPKFAHRLADNGTVESVCQKCFVTVSRTWGNFSLTAEELHQIESAHVCDQKRKVPPANRFR